MRILSCYNIYNPKLSRNNAVDTVKYFKQLSTRAGFRSGFFNTKLQIFFLPVENGFLFESTAFFLVLRGVMSVYVKDEANVSERFDILYASTVNGLID